VIFLPAPYIQSMPNNDWQHDQTNLEFFRFKHWLKKPR